MQNDHNFDGEFCWFSNSRRESIVQTPLIQSSAGLRFLLSGFFPRFADVMSESLKINS